MTRYLVVREEGNEDILIQPDKNGNRFQFVNLTRGYVSSKRHGSEMAASVDLIKQKWDGKIINCREIPVADSTEREGNVKEKKIIMTYESLIVTYPENTVFIIRDKDGKTVSAHTAEYFASRNIDYDECLESVKGKKTGDNTGEAVQDKNLHDVTLLLEQEQKEKELYSGNFSELKVFLETVSQNAEEISLAIDEMRDLD